MGWSGVGSVCVYLCGVGVRGQCGQGGASEGGVEGEVDGEEEPLHRPEGLAGKAEEQHDTCTRAPQREKGIYKHTISIQQLLIHYKILDYIQNYYSIYSLYCNWLNRL